MENARQVQLTCDTGPRRLYGEPGGSAGSRSAASQQMRPQPSLCQFSEGGKALQLLGEKAQPAREKQLIPAIRPLGSDKHTKDLLYIGLSNFGYSCYQNATLQSLLGLRPFISEMVSLIPGSVRRVTSTVRCMPSPS